jgi:methyl-accepting chemotaxis protein
MTTHHGKGIIMKWFNNFSIRKQLLLGFISVLVLLIIISTFSLVRILNMQKDFKSTVNVTLANQLKVQQLNTNLKELLSGTRGYLLFNEDSMMKQSKDSLNNVKQLADELSISLYVEENKAILRDIQSNVNSYIPILDQISNTGKTDVEKAKQITVEGRIYITTAIELSDKLVGNLSVVAQNAVSKVDQDVKTNIILVIILSLAALLLGLLASAKVYMSTTRLVEKVTELTKHVLSSSQEIMSATGEIASGSQVQAESAETSNEMINEMALAIQSVAASSEKASYAAEQVVGLAAQGNDIVQRAISEMKDISSKIQELNLRSEKIGDIIEVIDEIADQTNLLALNAALEAARAGSAGKGFAVVADEVRKLAERSSHATKEIAALIKTIQQNTQEAVISAKAGDEASLKAGAAFLEIQKTIQQTAENITEIAAACEEQASQSAEVQTSIQSMAAIIEETAAGAEETAASTTEMVKSIENMNSLVARL